MCSWTVIIFLTHEIWIYFYFKAQEFWKNKLSKMNDYIIKPFRYLIRPNFLWLKILSLIVQCRSHLSELQRLGLIGNRSDSLITLYLPLITCPMSRARSHGWLIFKFPLDEVPKGEIMSKWLVYHTLAFEQSIHTCQLVASLFGSRITAFPLKCL